MKLFLVALLVGLASSGPMPSSGESDDQLWEMFMVEHSKIYSTPEEESRRKLIFLDNLQYIREHNKKYEEGQVSFPLATNHLSDLTDQEVSDTRFGHKSSGLSSPTAFFSSSPGSYVPDSFNWVEKGAVTPVKDQGACNTCWVFSAVGSLEGLNYIRTGQLVPLSVQNVIDCVGGCLTAGSAEIAFEIIKRNGGIETEQAYPYRNQSSEDICTFNPIYFGATDKGYVQIPVGDEQKLKEAVATIGPISIAIDTSDIRAFTHYHSTGILRVPNCRSDPGSLHHAVLLVGYGTTDDGEDFWLIKNSWGEKWGIGGYAMMPRNEDNYCGVATFAVYPLL